MPVILESINAPGPDDLKDLIRLYEDYPQSADYPPAPNVTDWITDKLKAGQRVFAGRFNGRINSAVWAIPSEHGWRLEQLCVRAATRRRGVARQLLTLLVKYAHREQRQLDIEDTPLTAATRALLSQTGFHCTPLADGSTLWTTRKPAEEKH